MGGKSVTLADTSAGPIGQAELESGFTVSVLSNRILAGMLSGRSTVKFQYNHQVVGMSTKVTP